MKTNSILTITILTGVLWGASSPALAGGPMCEELFRNQLAIEVDYAVSQVGNERAEAVASRMFETLTDFSNRHADLDAVDLFMKEVRKPMDEVAAFLRNHENYPVLNLKDNPRSQAVSEQYKRFTKNLMRLSRDISPATNSFMKAWRWMRRANHGVAKLSAKLQNNQHTLREELTLLGSETDSMRKAYKEIEKHLAELSKEIEFAEGVISALQEKVESGELDARTQYLVAENALPRMNRTLSELTSLSIVVTGVGEAIDQRIRLNIEVIEDAQSATTVAVPITVATAKRADIDLTPKKTKPEQVKYSPKMVKKTIARAQAFWDNPGLHDLILENFARLHIHAMSLSEYIEVATAASRYQMVDRILEEFVIQRSATMSVSDALHLSAQVRWPNAKDRVLREFVVFRSKSLTVDEVIEIAKLIRSTREMDYLLQEFYLARRSSMPEEDRMKLANVAQGQVKKLILELGQY